MELEEGRLKYVFNFYTVSDVFSDRRFIVFKLYATRRCPPCSNARSFPKTSVKFIRLRRYYLVMNLISVRRFCCCRQQTAKLIANQQSFCYQPTNGVLV